MFWGRAVVYLFYLVKWISLGQKLKLKMLISESQFKNGNLVQNDNFSF